MTEVLVLSRSNRGKKVAEPLAAVGIDSTLLIYRSVGDLQQIIGALRTHDVVISDSSDYIAAVSFVLSRVFRTSYLLRVRGIATVEARNKLDRCLGERDVIGVVNMVTVYVSTLLLLHCADARIYVSHHVKNELSLSKQYGDMVIRTPCLMIRELLVQSNTIHECKPRTGTVDTPVTVLAVSNFDHRDKTAALADALESIWGMINKNQDLELEIAGGGTYADTFTNQIPESDSIRYLGYVDNIAPIYANADIFVHFSYLDGYPSTVVEAAIAGLPVLVNDYGAMSEQVNLLKNGLVVSLADSGEKLERRLIELTNNPELRSKLGDRGRRIGVETHAIITIGRELRMAVAPFLSANQDSTT